MLFCCIPSPRRLPPTGTKRPTVSTRATMHAACAPGRESRIAHVTLAPAAPCIRGRSAFTHYHRWPPPAAPPPSPSSRRRGPPAERRARFGRPPYFRPALHHVSFAELAAAADGDALSDLRGAIAARKVLGLGGDDAARFVVRCVEIKAGNLRFSLPLGP